MDVDPRVNFPEPPADWVVPLPNIEKGEPMLSDVDTPGEWHESTYTSKMEKGNCKHHAIPTGAVPVPPEANGNRIVNGWTFNYRGWADNAPTGTQRLSEQVSAPEVQTNQTTDAEDL
jgi:hypothetical protein